MTSPRSVYSQQINALLFLQYKFQYQYYNRRVISCSSSYQWKPQLPSFIFTYLTVSYPQWSWHIQSVGKQLALRTLRKLPTLGREPSFCTLQNFRIGTEETKAQRISRKLWEKLFKRRDYRQAPTRHEMMWRHTVPHGLPSSSFPPLCSSEMTSYSRFTTLSPSPPLYLDHHKSCRVPPTPVSTPFLILSLYLHIRRSYLVQPPCTSSFSCCTASSTSSIHSHSCVLIAYLSHPSSYHLPLPPQFLHLPCPPLTIPQSRVFLLWYKRQCMKRVIPTPSLLLSHLSSLTFLVSFSDPPPPPLPPSSSFTLLFLHIFCVHELLSRKNPSLSVDACCDFEGVRLV